MLHAVASYRRYIWRSAWTDLRYRYAGTGMGVFWNVVNPLLQVLIYSLLFPFFRSRVDDSYAFFLCAGLFPWQSFSEGVVRGGQSLTRNAGYLRGLPVPAGVFVAQSALASLLGLLVTLLVLVLATLAKGEPPSLALLWIPLVAGLLQALAFGLSLGLSHLRLLFPDTDDVLRALLQIWMWSMPIVYPEATLGPRGQWLLLANPPYPFIRSIRLALLEQRHVEPQMLLAMLFWVAFFLALGSFVANALRRSARDLV